MKYSALAGAGFAAPWAWRLKRAGAEPLAMGLSDPALQPKFVELAPNALDPAFLYNKFSSSGQGQGLPPAGAFKVQAAPTVQKTGLVDRRGGRLRTELYGYGVDELITWPGQTVQVMALSAGGSPETVIRWENKLGGGRHLLPVDTNLHWCYSLPGYEQFSIQHHGVPMIPHVHGGNTDFQFDGNPEFFFAPGEDLVGPQWDFVEGGFTPDFVYNNNVPAGNLWYHDHALGITRLNVYAGLAGFYFVRDQFDTGGMFDSVLDLGLPKFPYELAYAIQDRMFTSRGALFYPAFPGDPFYDDFITGEGAVLPRDLFPGGGPTALAEFFGDHMLVNGRIWPKTNVEPRNYRMRLLNGCDSRFLVIQFVAVHAGDTNFTNAIFPIPFWVIGSDQGLGSPEMMDTLVIEAGGRYDVVFDFKNLQEKRVIMANIGGDAPFGGAFGSALDPGDLFPDRQTDRIMAFDVADMMNQTDDFDPTALPEYGGVANGAIPRRVALFEGKDEFGRLRPLLGTVAEDLSSATAYTWFQPPTEKPALGSTEEWEIYNFTGDAHPIHLHLVNFAILGRNEISFIADEEDPQAVPQHNGDFGTVAAISNIAEGAAVNLGTADGYFESAPKDMVTALPEQVTRIRAHFNKAGRYVWHCHILSHEDHEMMRVLEVT